MTDAKVKTAPFPWPEDREARVGALTPASAVDQTALVIWEGLMSLQTLIGQIDALESLTPTEPVSAEMRASGGGIMISEIGILEHCKGIGDALALASLTLFERGKLNGSKDQRARAAKAKVVDATCAGLDVSIFHDRKLRDRMVHVDEWIPRIARQHPDSPWVTGMGLTHRNMIFSGSDHVPVIYNRTFIFDERKILHLGTELDLRTLRASAMAVINRLAW